MDSQRDNGNFIGHSVGWGSKKGKQCPTNHITNQGNLQIKVTSFIDFTDEPAIQCDIPLAQNTFVGDCK